MTSHSHLPASTGGRAVRARRQQRGFTMVEILAALAIASLMLMGIALMVNRSLDDAKGQQTALYQQQLANAAAQLVAQNATALAATATAAKPVVVPLTGAPYQLASFLPAGVLNQNAYGQTPCLLVYAGAAGSLQALLVTEGGARISDGQLGYIAANAGSGAGSIPATGNAAGAALGAFGAWRVAAPNPAGASCSGTPTGVGHLVSQVGGSLQAQNSDYLYRIQVPGDPAANTMQVPIVLAQQVDYATCNQGVGALAADAGSNLVTCTNGIWQPAASFHWRDPVAAAADLGNPALMPNPQLGDVAMTTNTGRAYTFNGTAWQALAVDEQGNLNLGNQAVVNTACAPNQASTTPVTTDASGRVLSCQSGLWQLQTEIEPASTATGCTIVMASPNANDYPQCGPAPAGAYATPPNFAYNAANGTYSYLETLNVQLTKPGILTVAAWAHLNDGICGANRGARAQLLQALDVYQAGSNQSLAHTESQTPTLQDDSGGINNDLTQALQPGNYTVVVSTNWATYAVIGTPWTSSLCGEQGQTIPNSPVVAGWTVNTYY